MNNTDALPIHAEFLDSLLQNLSSTSSTTAGITNSTTDVLPSTAKQLLLTLHVLHPHHTLEALDLLDRGLVTRLIVCPPTSPLANLDAGDESAVKQYHVRSAQGAAHRSHHARDYSAAASESSTYYNVHLAAWSCSCPAFAYAAYPSATAACVKTLSFRPDEQLGFGGLPGMLASDTAGNVSPPLCKHLLACVLAEECAELFGVAKAGDGAAVTTKGCVGVRVKIVGVEEAAGWAAGGGSFI